MARKRKIAIYGIDARGHTRPLLQLARGLVDAGCDVDYLTPSDDTGEFVDIGATIIKMRTDITNHTRAVPVPKDFDQDWIINSIKVRTVGDSVDNLPKVIEYLNKHRPDVLLFDKMCLAGNIAARHCDVPSAMLHPTYCGSHALKGCHPVFDVPDNPEIYAKIDQYIADLNEISPHASQTISHLFSDHQACNISFLSSDFHPLGGDLFEKYHFVGPLLPDRMAESEGGREIIYISLGSIVGAGQDQFFRDCLKVFNDEPEVVLSVVNAMNFVSHDLGDIPPNVTIIRSFDQAEQIRRLKQAKLFVTHGGMNSVQEAIWCETPMVVVPFGFDSELTGERVEALRCGAKLARAACTIDTIAQSAASVMKSAEIRSGLRTQREYARAAGGLAKAVSLINAL